MKFLLQNGADVDAKLKFGFHYTAFHVAAFFGHLDLVQIFVKNGLNVNVRNSNEETLSMSHVCKATEMLPNI